MAIDPYNQHYFNARIWTEWTSTTSSSMPTTSSSVSMCYPNNNSIWELWQDATTCSTTSASSEVWHVYYDDGIVWDRWISDETIEQVILSEKDFKEINSRVFKNVINGDFKIKTESDEKRRARKMQERIRHEWNKILAEEREEEKRQAEITAQELLLELISDEEMARYKETGRLFVKGKKFDYLLKKGGGVYRIEKKKVLDFAKKKKALGKYICVSPKQSYNFPETDNVISLKMWIENAEKEFLKIGNLHRTEETINDFDKIVGL